jgi:glycosyltransferase involved in cell wall biosynthesis
VQAEIPTETLTLVGDGSQHEALVKLAKETGLKNVTFTGRVDNKEIYHYLDKADVILSTPIVDNMPVSLLEAMNAGLLVISSNVGGVPYMITNGRTGLLFDSNNDKELAEKMLWAINNQDNSKTIIQQAHQAVGEYRWDNVKEKLYTAYGIPS